jgi:6-pyruvoyltetrahydropterin/6-carboxytetrahydropterin synthase
MKVLLAHEFRFEAAHRLPCVPDGHKCARLHGHSFRIEVAVRGPVDAAAGWLCDYQHMLDAWAPLHDALDHRYLNEVAGLANPTSENLAAWIWQRLAPSLVGLCRVTVAETCEARCEYEGSC